MKKFLLISVLVLSSGSALSAQTDVRYRFDNFDTRDGVQIEVPPAKLVARKSSRRIKPTARTVEPELSSASTVTNSAPPMSRVDTMTVSKSLDGFSTGDANVDSFIADSGSRNGVDPVLLYAIMHQESSFKKRAISHAGARGLMQLMPGTAARFGVKNIFDPRQNIEGGTRYMRFLLDLFDGDVALALAGYNAGEGAVLKYGRRVPPYSETRNYVRRITHRYSIMRDPETARRARVASGAQLAAMKSAEKPVTLYEREVFAVKTPDGKLQLVSQ